jgi:hypothetical protein
MHKGRGADSLYLSSQGCNLFISTTHTLCTSNLSEAAPEPKRRIASSELTLESLSQSPRFEDGTLTAWCRERELWFHTNNIFLAHASICRYLGQTITLTLRVFFLSSVAAPKNLSERRLQYKFAWTAFELPRHTHPLPHQSGYPNAADFRTVCRSVPNAPRAAFRGGRTLLGRSFPHCGKL